MNCFLRGGKCIFRSVRCSFQSGSLSSAHPPVVWQWKEEKGAIKIIHWPSPKKLSDYPVTFISQYLLKKAAQHKRRTASTRAPRLFIDLTGGLRSQSFVSANVPNANGDSGHSRILEAFWRTATHKIHNDLSNRKSSQAAFHSMGHCIMFQKSWCQLRLVLVSAI